MWHTDPSVAQLGATGDTGIAIPTASGAITFHADTSDVKGWKAFHRCGGRSEKTGLTTTYEMRIKRGHGVAGRNGGEDTFITILLCSSRSCSQGITLELGEQMPFSEIKVLLQRREYQLI